MSHKPKKPQFRPPMSEAELAFELFKFWVYVITFWLLFGSPLLTIISRVLK